MEFFHKRLPDGRLCFRLWRIEWGADGDDTWVEQFGEVGAEGTVVLRPLARQRAAQATKPDTKPDPQQDLQQRRKEFKKAAVAEFEAARTAEGYEYIDPFDYGALEITWSYDGPWERSDDDALDALADRVDAALKAHGLGGCTGQHVMQNRVALSCTVIDVAIAERVATAALTGTDVAPFVRFGGSEPLERLWEGGEREGENSEQVPGGSNVDTRQR